MTTISRETGQDTVARFVRHLLSLAERDDRGALAALRRSLQAPTGIAMSACPYVVPFLPPSEAYPGRPDSRGRAYFLIGALFALHPEHEEGVSLGHAFRGINSDTAEGKKGLDNQSTRARFVALLDAHEDDVADHLRHAISLVRAKNRRIDWERTLKQLLGWGAPDRWAQQQLANDFWSEPLQPNAGSLPEDPSTTPQPNKGEVPNED